MALDCLRHILGKFTGIDFRYLTIPYRLILSYATCLSDEAYRENETAYLLIAAK